MQGPGRELLMNKLYSLYVLIAWFQLGEIISAFILFVASKLINGYIRGKYDLCFKDY